MRVLINAAWLAPYRIDLFNEMANYADVTVYYRNTSSDERNDKYSASFSESCRYIKMRTRNLPILGTWSNDFLNEVRKNRGNYDVILFDAYGSLIQVKDIFYVAKKGIKYFVNVDGALIRENEKKLVSRLKKLILRKDCYYLCGAKVSNKYLEHYGVKSDRILNHPFTSLFKKDLMSECPTPAVKAKLREKLGMKEKHIILSVGRFTYLKGYGKGYDAVLRAAARMPKDYGFYIVGDEPTEEFIQMRDRLGATNVHFVGFRQKEELKEYYIAADLFILMTVYDVWGLVINEAMATGLPIITTDMCVAGLDLVEDGDNGYIVKVGDDEMLEKRIYDVLDDEATCRRMARRSLEKIRPYTIENVAAMHMKVFEDFLAGRLPE